MLKTFMIGMSLGASITSLYAGEAAFGEDGNTVYEVNGSNIKVVHTDTGEVSEIAVEGVSEPKGIARAEGGAFYLVSEDALWRWMPGEPAKLIERAGEQRAFTNVASSSTGEQVLVTGGAALFYRADPNAPLQKVFLRHLPNAEIPALEFLSDDTVLFSAEGDLWHGKLGNTAATGDPAQRVDLTAYRYAPIAERFTYSGNSAEYGVRDIACGAGYVYVQLGRIGGSGSTGTFKLAMPQIPEGESFRLHNRVEDSARVLQSAQRISDGGLTHLCASPDRKKVYMHERGNLVEGANEGETRLLAVGGVEEGKPVAFATHDKAVDKAVK